MAEQTAYRCLLDYMVSTGGWVMLAAQAPPAGGDPVPGKQATHNAGQLAALLGPDYSLQQHFQQPYSRCGELARVYTYALFQRNAQAAASFRQMQFATA